MTDIKNLEHIFGPMCHNKSRMLDILANNSHRYCYFESSSKESLKNIQQHIPGMTIQMHEDIGEKRTYRFYRTSIIAVDIMLNNISDVKVGVSGVQTTNSSHPETMMTWVIV